MEVFASAGQEDFVAGGGQEGGCMERRFADVDGG